MGAETNAPTTRFALRQRWRNCRGPPGECAEVPGTEVRVFPMADATACAAAGQVTPDGSYSIESMLRGLIAKKSLVGSCPA